MSKMSNGNDDEIDIVDDVNFEDDSDDDELEIGDSVQTGAIGSKKEHDENDDDDEDDDDDDDEDDDDEDDDDENNDDEDDDDENNDDENDDDENDEDEDKDNDDGVEIQQGGTLMDYIGGTQELEGNIEIEEDILGESNKKIVYHDEILLLHPESQSHNYDEITKVAIVTRNEENIIIDRLHQTTPILTKYERARILGQRTKQLDRGENPFVTMNKPIMDNSIIAEEELYQKKLPFIIQRRLPGGGFEYWHVKDLEVLL